MILLGFSRIGRYQVASDSWSFYYYPLEQSFTDFEAWVGLSEITAIDDETFLVIERDNQANVDAVVKRIYQFSIVGLTPHAEPDLGEIPDFPVVEKFLEKDLMKGLRKAKGLILEKIEGMAISKKGDLYIINDNDGVDNSNGETQLLRIEDNYFRYD